MRKTIFATLALTALISGEAYSQTTWTTVANEYQQFSLSSARTVRYGAGSSWVEKTLSGTQSCATATFGRDPAVGVTKICQAATVTTTTTSTTWSNVASEFSSFTLSGTKNVRFGTGSSWVEKTLSGTQSCTIATFGRDPASGVAKVCQAATTTTSTSTAGTTTGTGTSSGTTTTTPTTSTWSTVASEWANFSLSSAKNVRYGTGSSWVEKTLSGTQSCTNTTFGRDPASGLAKVCQVLVSSATSGSGTTSGSTSGSTGSTGGTGSTGSTGGTTTTPKTYTASLSWTIPSTRTDGKPLTASELAGYEVYYTNDTGSVSASVRITGAATVATLVNNLPSGNYHFSISAVDLAGLKSPLSAMASLTFP